MKNTWIATLATCAMVAFTVSGDADDLRKAASPPAKQPAQRIEVRKVAPESATMTLRASMLNGMTIRNSTNKEIGSIKDFVVTMPEGKIRYLAVSYGGFLGVGDKLFAVPAGVFQIERDHDSNTTYLVLDIPEDYLKNAPGFDESHWPNFADPKWQKEVDTYFHIGSARSGVDVRVGRQAQPQRNEIAPNQVNR